MNRRRILTAISLTLLAICFIAAGCRNSQAALFRSTAANSNAPEFDSNNFESARDRSSSDELQEYAVYKSIIDKLFQKYGEFRISSWKDESEDPNRTSREVNGVCYLRLLDFDNDGDLELYAVCKNENEENYTGLVYAANNGLEQIFEAPVNCKSGYWTERIELVCKGETKYFVLVSDHPDGRGGKDTDTLYGYDSRHPDSFTYTRTSTVQETQGENDTWDTEYRISDPGVNGEWMTYSETEFEEIEKNWWADTVLETALCVRSSSGEIDEEQMTASLSETMQIITGDPNVEVTNDSDKQTVQFAGDDSAPFYGIWCAASKDEGLIEDIAIEMRENGLPAEVYITTDWSNLNTERWYVISAGRYASREEAENALPQVKKYYNDAYIKYSGECIR